MPFAVVAGDPAPQQLTAPCRKYSGRLHPPLEQAVYRSISFCFMPLGGGYRGRHSRKSCVDYIFDLASGTARFLRTISVAISCFGVLPTPIYAQAAGSISGRVVDARTGAGLEKVLVLVEDGGPSTQTDGTGAFRVATISAGPHRLYVSVIGYILVRREVLVPAGGNIDLTIPLSEGTGTYTETVTVAADRFRDRRSGRRVTAGARERRYSESSRRARGRSACGPSRCCRAWPPPTICAASSACGAAPFTHLNMTVDGFSTPYLLHTVRAIEDQSSSGSVAMINSDILEDVTLLNGGYAQRYGDRTGAEVDFRLREGSRERRQARVGGERHQRVGCWRGADRRMRSEGRGSSPRARVTCSCWSSA